MDAFDRNYSVSGHLRAKMAITQYAGLAGGKSLRENVFQEGFAGPIKQLLEEMSAN